jgi:hypothetical protein
MNHYEGSAVIPGRYAGGAIATTSGDGWLFTKPDGQPCQPWVTDQQLAWHLDSALHNQHQAHDDRLAGVDSFQHPEAVVIRPRWAGEPFHLHACVQALFTTKLPEPRTDNLDQQAA